MPIPRVPVQKCMPMRKLVAVECFFGLTFNYILRNCLSLAIIKMTGKHKGNATVAPDPNGCPYDPSQEEEDEIDGDLTWTAHQKQMVLGAYFYGYLFSMIPAGILGDKVGASPMLMAGTLISIVVTFLTPIASRIHWAVTFAIRVVLGIGQAMYYAPLHCIVAAWIPPRERGTWGAVLFSGSHAGSFLNALLTGFMLGSLKWDWVFYIWGSAALIWLLLYSSTASYSSPESCNLTEKEKAVFEEAGMHYKAHSLAAGKTWLAILSNLPVWAIIVGMWGHDFGLFSLTTELPTFMKDVLHFNIRKNGWMNSLVFLSIWMVGNATGPLIDYVDRKKLINRKLNRIIGTTISSVGPSVGLLLSVYTNCSVTLAMTSLFVGSALMGFFYSSLKLSPIDIAPAFSGTIGAITQTAGAIAGACVPLIVGGLVSENEGTLNEWRAFMWTVFVAMSATNIFYIFFASADPQGFNSPEDAQRIEDEKAKKKEDKEKKKADKEAKKKGAAAPQATESGTSAAE